MPSTTSKAWGAIVDEHENQPGQLPKFTAGDASRKTWLRCKETDFGPRTLFGGEKYNAWDMHASLSQPKATGSRISRPFVCFFCRTDIGPGVQYFRLPDPTGKSNGDSTQKIHYIHGDGSECVGKEVPEDNTAPCAGCDRADVVLHGVMGVGKPQYFYCTRCAYTKRADINNDVQEFSEIKRLERVNGRTPSTPITDATPIKRQRSDCWHLIGVASVVGVVGVLPFMRSRRLILENSWTSLLMSALLV